MNRIIAVCSWSLRPEGPADLLQAVERVGLRSVQLALSPLVLQPARWQGVAEMLRGAGLRIVSGMMAFESEDYATPATIRATGGVRPDAAWPDNLAHARQVAEVAAETGLDLVTFHAGFLPHDPADPERSRLIDRLRRIAAIFAGHGVRLGLETGQERAETLASVLDELDRPEVGVNFDPANMILYGMGDPIEALRRLAPRVVQLHVKDALPPAEPGAWGREVPVPTGAVDWREFLACADAIEPPVACVIEREAGETRDADVRAAAAMLRQEESRS